MKPFYLSTNGNNDTVPGGIALDVSDIRVIGDHGAMQDDLLGFNIYLKSGEVIPVIFSPDVSRADALDKHTALVHSWLKANEIPTHEFDIAPAAEAIVAVSDPDGKMRSLAGGFGILVGYLLSGNFEEDVQPWKTVEGFVEKFLSGNDVALQEYYRVRDENTEQSE